METLQKGFFFKKKWTGRVRVSTNDLCPATLVKACQLLGASPARPPVHPTVTSGSPAVVFLQQNAVAPSVRTEGKGGESGKSQCSVLLTGAQSCCNCWQRCSWRRPSSAARRPRVGPQARRSGARCCHRRSRGRGWPWRRACVGNDAQPKRGKTFVHTHTHIGRGSAPGVEVWVMDVPVPGGTCTLEGRGRGHKSQKGRM